MSDTPRTDAEALRINNINTPNRERVDDYHDMFVFACNLDHTVFIGSVDWNRIPFLQHCWSFTLLIG